MSVKSLPSTSNTKSPITEQLDSPKEIERVQSLYIYETNIAQIVKTETYNTLYSQITKLTGDEKKEIWEKIQLLHAQIKSNLSTSTTSTTSSIDLL